MMYVHRHENRVLFLRYSALSSRLWLCVGFVACAEFLRLDDGVGQEGAWRLIWLVLNPFTRRLQALVWPRAFRSCDLDAFSFFLSCCS
jgi:hypothetical protein